MRLGGLCKGEKKETATLRGMGGSGEAQPIQIGKKIISTVTFSGKEGCWNGKNQGTIEKPLEGKREHSRHMGAYCNLEKKNSNMSLTTRIKGREKGQNIWEEKFCEPSCLKKRKVYCHIENNLRRIAMNVSVKFLKTSKRCRGLGGRGTTTPTRIPIMTNTPGKNESRSVEKADHRNLGGGRGTCLKRKKKIGERIPASTCQKSQKITGGPHRHSRSGG